MFVVSIQTPLGGDQWLHWQNEDQVRRILLERTPEQTIYVFSMMPNQDDYFGTHPITGD